MSGIYLHIPFCKKRCYYCDFYSTTQLKQIPVLVEALKHELVLRKNYLPDEAVETVYFGGGTPSLLSTAELEAILEVIKQNYPLSADAEITIEANPDDLSDEYLQNLAKTPVNRISIGIQSFDDEQLKNMNRRHTALQGIEAVAKCKKHGFINLSIDLIYGLPGMQTDDWKKQLEQAAELDVPHISAYHLTYEKGTVFETRLQKNELHEISEATSLEQFKILMDWAKQNGYEHYEISNFARPGMNSKHNTSYWQQKAYLGIGPAAHSFDLKTRSWNISNLKEYLAGIEKNQPVIETEILSEIDRFNEYILTSLRTKWGIDFHFINNNFEGKFTNHIQIKSIPYINNNQLSYKDKTLSLTKIGLFIADSIITDLIYID